MSETLYSNRIKNRNVIQFWMGLIIRFLYHLKFSYIRRIAIKNGATIGENSILPYKLAKNANTNLTVGKNCSIQSNLIDLRAKVTIGDKVIIGENVEIITVSHNIDSLEWEQKYYGITIEDYVWVATKALILPSCTKLAKGTVCSGGSVVVKNTEEMDVVAGNPAIFLRKRTAVHDNLVVESLLGGDYKKYLEVYRNK